MCARQGFVPVRTRFKVAAVGAGRGRPQKKSVGPAASADSGPRQSGKLEARQGSGTGTRTRLDPKGRVPEVEAPPATGDSVGQSSEASRLPGESVLHDRVLLSLR